MKTKASSLTELYRNHPERWTKGRLGNVDALNSASHAACEALRKAIQINTKFLFHGILNFNDHSSTRFENIMEVIEKATELNGKEI